VASLLLSLLQLSLCLLLCCLLLSPSWPSLTLVHHDRISRTATLWSRADRPMLLLLLLLLAACSAGCWLHSSSPLLLSWLSCYFLALDHDGKWQSFPLAAIVALHSAHTLLALSLSTLRAVCQNCSSAAEQLDSG
jgi:hypothetical protein